MKKKSGKKKFILTIKLKEINHILAQELIVLGDEKKPFPDDWKDNSLALNNLENITKDFLNRYIEVSYKEGDEFDI